MFLGIRFFFSILPGFLGIVFFFHFTRVFRYLFVSILQGFLGIRLFFFILQGFLGIRFFSFYKGF